MYRKLFVLFILLNMFLLPVTATADSESRALVIQGRELLFNSGNISYQGIVDADKLFESAVAADPADQEACLFHAVTRIAAFVLENGDGSGIQTLADLFTAMGIPIYLDRLIDQGMPFGDLPEITDSYSPPETMPGGDDIWKALNLGLVAVIDQSIADLDAVEETLQVTLTAEELGDVSGLEIDYSDVLLFKGVLHLLKSVVLTITAYDLDSVDIRDLIALTNTGMWKFQSGIVNGFLEEYPDFLKLTATGAGDLSNAKTALIAASQYFSDAQMSLENETDDSQDNDLFVYENEGDEMEFTGFVNGLSELKDSLVENRPATSKYFRYAWDVAADNGDEIHLVLNEDVFGNGTRWREGSDFRGTVGGQQVSGQLVFWERDGDVVTAVLDYCGYKRIVAVGTLGGDAQTLSGHCTYLEYNGFEFVEKSVSSFTADQAYFWADDLEQVDFNALFGNAEKSQLVIREVLPEFDLFGEPMAGTFPEPFLNGLLPDLTSNDVVAAELELDPPYQVFEIPVATIVLDGEKSDWPTGSLVAEDQDGLLLDGLEQARGIDMIQTFLAKDSQYLYVAMALAGTPATTDSYNLNLNKHRDNHWQDVLNIRVWYDSSIQTWQISGFSRDAAGNYESIDITPNSHVATGDGFIEWRVPLDTLGDLTSFGGSWISFGTFSQAIYQGDWLDANARLAPVYKVTGTVAVPEGYTGGNIYYYLWDQGWDPFANNAWKVLKKYGFSGTFTESAGSFSLTDVPYSSTDMYLHVFWDKDGNGIPNSGDYTGMTPLPAVQDDVDLGAIALTNPVPGLPLADVSVKHVTPKEDVSEIYFDIMIGSSFTGNLPDDIESITVTGPDGTLYPIWPNENTDWLAFDNTFFAILPGTPALGEYTFVVTGRDGSVGIQTDTQKDLFTIPVVDTNMVRIDTASKTPMFSWEPVHVPGTDLTYRLEIQDPSSSFYFRSGRGWGMTACTGPELEPGKQYYYRIRAMDHSNWVQVDNRSHTDWISFTMNNTLSHSSVPAIDPDTWGAVIWFHAGTSSGVDLWCKVIDHDGVSYDGSSHFVYARPLDESGNLLGEDRYPLHYISTENAEAVFFEGWVDNWDQMADEIHGFKFFAVDPDGNQGVLTDMMTTERMTPPQDIGLTCTVNGTTPTFTWKPVPGAHFYRIRIYDKNGTSTVLKWNAPNTTSTTIPPGYLAPGTTYQYRLEAKDSHWGLDTDENIVFPVRNMDNQYPVFTTGPQTDTPFAVIHDVGVTTWNNRHLGPVTSFWIKVYDSQGVNDIKAVKVIHPDGETETPLFFEYQESSNCAIYSNDAYDAAGPQSGTYTFVVTDRAGHQFSITENLDVSPIGFPDRSSLNVTVVNETGAEFTWDAVENAAFYRVEIYDRYRNRIYRLATTKNHYSLAPGFLKKGETYSFRITTRREFFDQNVDNGSSSPWSMYDTVSFKTGPINDGGTHMPGIDTQNFGAAVTYLTNPVSGDPLYWLQFSVRVTDEDGVPENIKSVTVSGPGIAGDLLMGFDWPVDGNTGEYWVRQVYHTYDDIPEGIYTFRVEDEDGKIAETTDVLTKNPVPFAPNMTPADGSVVPLESPVISWDAPDGGPYFYRVRVYQHWSRHVHSSGILSDTYYVIPEQVLVPGEQYYYRLYVYDKDIRTRDVNNLSMTGVFGPDINRFSTAENSRERGLADVFRLIRILMGQTTEIPSFDVDVNQDNRMDMKDVIPILQESGNLR